MSDEEHRERIHAAARALVDALNDYGGLVEADVDMVCVTLVGGDGRDRLHYSARLTFLQEERLL